MLADAEQFRRALRNLLDTAVKYSPAAPSIQVDLRVEHGQVCIVVRNHGMGISKEDLKRVFRNFERGSGMGPPAIGRPSGGLRSGRFICHAESEQQFGSQLNRACAARARDVAERTGVNRR